MPARPDKPLRLSIGGECYVPVVLLIHTKHPDGSPALMTSIPEDRKIDLAGGEEFMVAFAPRSMVKPGR